MKVLKKKTQKKKRNSLKLQQEKKFNLLNLILEA